MPFPKILRFSLIIFSLTGMLLSACGPSLSPAESTIIPTPPLDPEESQKFIMRAKAELSRQEGINPEEINLVSIEFTEFPDASLGVPEPGVNYAQVLTPGYIIFLEYQGETYEFHAAEERIVRVPEQ